MAFDLSTYEPVSARVAKFYGDHPAGRILTELVRDEPPQFIVKAAVYRGDEDFPWATGYAEEIVGKGNVNQTSALENCETSAVGRALANAGYAPSDSSKRPSREEMEKVERGVERPMTDKQRKAIYMMLEERDVSQTELPNVEELSMRAASAFMDTLKKLPQFPKAERRGPTGENADVYGMKLPEIKAELERLGVTGVAGTKAQLTAALIEARSVAADPRVATATDWGEPF